MDLHKLRRMFGKKWTVGIPYESPGDGADYVAYKNSGIRRRYFLVCRDESGVETYYLEPDDSITCDEFLTELPEETISMWIKAVDAIKKMQIEYEESQTPKKEKQKGILDAIADMFR